MKQVDLAGFAMESSTGMPLLMLREQDEPHRLLPVFIGPPEAAAIATALSGQQPMRPLTHDLMAALVESLEGRLDAVEVTGFEDGAFLASLAVHGPSGDRRVDTRPSDAIALAVRLGAPLFVADDVLDEAGSIPEPDSGTMETEMDTAEIDAAVEEFRSLLDDVDASAFADTEMGDTGVGETGGEEG